jgi:hypothetical protein
MHCVEFKVRLVLKDHLKIFLRKGAWEGTIHLFVIEREKPKSF